MTENKKNTNTSKSGKQVVELKEITTHKRSGAEGTTHGGQKNTTVSGRPPKKK